MAKGKEGVETPKVEAVKEVKEVKEVKVKGVKWIVLRPLNSMRSNLCGFRVDPKAGGENGGVILSDAVCAKIPNMSNDAGTVAKHIGGLVGWDRQVYTGASDVIVPKPREPKKLINWDTLSFGDLQEKILHYRTVGTLKVDELALNATREKMIEVLKTKEG